jgi:hypothetical protein
MVAKLPMFQFSNLAIFQSLAKTLLVYRFNFKLLTSNFQPPTSQLLCGEYRSRTDDLLLAKQAL